MGLIQAAIGAVGGTLGDQWLDFYGVPDGVPSTAALFPAVRKGENAGRGGNDRASDGVITNGSKIIVPEGYGLVLLEDGSFTGFFKDVVLLEQASVQDSKKSVKAVLDEAGVTVTNFARLEVGGA